MKLTILLLTAGLLQVSAKTTGQTVTVSGKDLKLEQVFSIVKEQTGFVVFATMDVLKDAKPISVNVKQMPVSDFMNIVLKDQGLMFEISNETILVSKNVESVVKDVSPRVILDAPEAEPIKGVVKDSTGMPLSGATVMNKRTKKSVMTDAKGEFSIEGEEGDVLMMSYVGFEKQNVNVMGSSVFAVLRTSTSPLDEVQIKAYGTTSRRLNTGNITTITSEDIAKQPVNNSLLALMGRVPNLVVTQTSGMPGAPIKLQLRGQNSIGRTKYGANVASEPLIIIDGIPFVNNIIGANNYGSTPNLNALNFINIADIESINVLADADATSIYGSRGGNGVIIITTKRAKGIGNQITINSSIGFSDVEKKLDLLSTPEYLAMRKQAFQNDGLSVPNFQTNPEEKNDQNYDLTLWDQNRNTDWQKEILGKTAASTEVSLSISGGNNAVQYLIGGNYSSQDYVFPGDAKWQNVNGHLGLNTASNNQKLRTGLTLNYGRQKSKNTGDLTLFAVRLAPNAPALYKDNGELNWEPNPNTGMATWENPLARTLRTIMQNTSTISTSFDISYSLLPGLTLKTILGFTDLRLDGLSITPLASFDPYLRRFVTGSTLTNNTSINTWTVDPQLSFKKLLGVHNLDFLIGGNFQGSNSNFGSIYATGFHSDAFLYDLSFASQTMNRNTSTQYRYLGAFGRISYDWKKKYIMNFSARRDGSSRFGSGRQFGEFWSFGGAWIFSEETFFKDKSDLLSFGKIRASYGTSGNDGVGDYGYLELFNTSELEGIQYQGLTMLSSSGATNSDYSWEDLKRLEVALETGFFNDRIIISAAFWQTRVDNQLGNFNLPSTSGAETIIMNRPAKIQNSGADFTLNSKNIIGKTFNWTTNFNLGLQRNKLLALPDAFGFISPYKDPVGKPFGNVVSLYEFRGVNPDVGMYQFAGGDGNTITPDPNSFGNGESGNAKTILTSPEYSGGISNTFSYRGFSLDVFFHFAKQVGRNYLYQNNFGGQPGQFIGSASVGNAPKGVINTSHGTSPAENIQQFSTLYGGRYSSYARATESDLAWVDASFIRLKNLALYYSIPAKWKERSHFKSIRLYVVGQNLLTITKYKGTDPETQSVTALPPLRTVRVGISLGL